MRLKINLDNENLTQIRNELWHIQGSLKGISSLLQNQSEHTFLEQSDLFGLGQCLDLISNRLSDIEDSLISN